MRLFVVKNSVLAMAAILGLITAGCGAPEQQGSKFSFDAANANASIFVALGVNVADDSYALLISAKKEADEVTFCKATGSQCEADAYKSSFAKELGERKIYKSNDSIQISDGLSLRFEARSNDQIVDTQVVTFKKEGAATPVVNNGNDYDWRTEIQFKDVQQAGYNGNTYGSAFFKDVMSHSKRPYLGSTPLTNVHETLHFMQHENGGPANTKFIYYRGGKGALFPEPLLKTAAAEKYIPRAVVQKTKLYNTYIRKRPTQVIGENMVDEWKAYITEAIALVEITKAGQSVTNDCIEGGSMEFLIFVAAAMQALLEQEPEHLEKTNTKAIFAMLAEETRNLYDSLLQVSSLKHTHSKDLFEHLQSNPDSQSIRDALKTIYGGAWTQRVLGF